MRWRSRPLVTSVKRTIAFRGRSVDPFFIDAATMARQLTLNSVSAVALECTGVSQALVVVCVFTWGALVLVLGLMACAQYQDGTRTVLTFDDEQLTYTDAIKIMRDTTVDLAVEPGFHDSFGRRTEELADEVDTDAATGMPTPVGIARDVECCRYVCLRVLAENVGRHAASVVCA